MTKCFKMIFLLIFSIILIGCSNVTKNNSDSINFKKEYESFNGKVTDEISYHNVTINEENIVVYSNYEEIFEILEKGSGIIFFGNPENQLCRSILPVLLESLDSVGVDKLYYLNNINDRDILSLSENGEVIVEKEASQNYSKLLGMLKDKASIYEGMNNPKIKRLYYPTVVFIKDGTIIDVVVGSVKSHTDQNLELSYEQKEELGALYMNNASIVMGLVCSDIC